MTRGWRWQPMIGGAVIGGGIGLMHYTGMWAVQTQGTIAYDKGLVALSILIAVVVLVVVKPF
jgi:NO-binding membrane sensor protein with MHYT domain